MLYTTRTDVESSSDETTDRVYLERSCDRLECTVQEDVIPEYLISDDSASGLVCSNCRQKFNLRLILKARSCQVYVEAGEEIFYDGTALGDLHFPSNWSVFIIERGDA